MNKKYLFAAFLFLVMIFGASPMSAQCGYWTGPCPNPNPWGVPPPPTPHIECGRMPDGRIVCFCDGCNSVIQTQQKQITKLVAIGSKEVKSEMELEGNFEGKETKKEDGYYIEHRASWSNDEHPRRYRQC